VIYYAKHVSRLKSNDEIQALASVDLHAILNLTLVERLDSTDLIHLEWRIKKYEYRVSGYCWPKITKTWCCRDWACERDQIAGLGETFRNEVKKAFMISETVMASSCKAVLCCSKALSVMISLLSYHEGAPHYVPKVGTYLRYLM
jgi:hypothetical protein